MTARRSLRLTRRGRLLLSVTSLAAAAGVVLALDGGRADVAAPGLTAGAAVAVPSPSPSPPPSPARPAWRPAVPAAVADGFGHVDRLAATAPVVVVADLTDRFDRDLATWLAARLQAVVVAGEPDALAGLGTGLVVAVGDVAVPHGAEVRRVSHPAPAATAPVDQLAGPLQIRRAARVADAGEPPVPADLSAVADLLADAGTADPTGVVLLARPAGVSTAEVATALALGHRVVVTAAADPRSDAALASSLSAAGGATSVATVGQGWEDLDRPDWTWKLAVARRGLTLPGGGQLVFPGRMIVALYGHPDGPALGVLGEQPLDETLVRAAEQAAAYDDLVDLDVVPALEIIATVASGAAGPHGDHSRRTPIEQLRPYVDAAREAGAFVLLDLQPGRTDFLTQAKLYEELLREPHVGLALDPEWRLGPNERHLVRIGSVTAAEVNAVVSWLADLTRAEALPQKLLVLHQFKHSMVSDRETVDTSRDELAVVLHVDGQGGQPAKLATYASLLRDLPSGMWVGWKNFHDEDRPMRSEAETVALDPMPVLVTYQ